MLSMAVSINRLVERVRTLLRDFPEYNTLWQIPGGPEFTTEEIRQALEFALDRVNLVSPITNYTWKDLPEELEQPLLQFAIYFLLNMKAREIGRNNVEFQSGGVVADYTRVLMEYAQAAQTAEERAEMLTQRYKVAKNIEEGFGLIDSPFGCLDWW